MKSAFIAKEFSLNEKRTSSMDERRINILEKITFKFLFSLFRAISIQPRLSHMFSFHGNTHTFDNILQGTSLTRYCLILLDAFSSLTDQCKLRSRLNVNVF